MHSPRHGTRKSVSRIANSAFGFHKPSTPNEPSAVDIKVRGTLSGVELSSRDGLFPMLYSTKQLYATPLPEKDSV